MTDHLDDDRARLELNANGFRFDPVLDPIADRIEQDRGSWSSIPPKLFDQAQMYSEFRSHHRAAVKAGVIPDDKH